jgi:hypothetical protein
MDRPSLYLLAKAMFAKDSFLQGPDGFPQWDDFPNDHAKYISAARLVLLQSPRSLSDDREATALAEQTKRIWKEMVWPNG